MKTFADFGIDLGGRAGVEVQTTCPQCSPERKKPKVACLSVNTEKGVWCCHHCGWVGSLKTGTDQPSRRERVVIRPPDLRPDSGDPELVAWFSARVIPQAILEREGVGLVMAYMPQVEAEVPCIAFPYFRNGEAVNIKYRMLAQKHFRQVAGAEKALAIDGNMLNPLREPDMDALSATDVECLQEAVETYGSLSFSQARDASHDAAWNATPRNTEMATTAIAATLANGPELLQHLEDRHPDD